MPTTLVPSIEQRLAAFIEMNRRAKLAATKAAPKPTITISREFGCEGYPLAEDVKKLVEQATGEPWALVDRSLLDAVAKNHSLSEEVLHSLGQKPRWLDEMLSMLSPRWKNDADYYQLLYKQIVSVAKAGNAVIVGMGAGIITQSLENCYQFRLIADQEFKVRSIARRLKISRQDAELIIEERQKERERYIRNFLNADINNPHYYHMIFNNSKIRTDRIARTISDFVLKD